MVSNASRRGRSNSRKHSTSRKRKASSSSKKPVFKKTKRFNKHVKKSSLNSNAQRVGNAHWLSFGKVMLAKSNKFLRKMEKELTPSFYIETVTNQVTIANGQQTVANFVIYNDTDIRACQQGCYNYLQAALQADTIGGISSTTRQFNSRTLLVSCQTKYLFTNTSNANVFIDIYDIGTRRDQMTQSNGAIVNPLTAWQQGNSVEMGGTDTASTVIGSNPFQSRMFTQMFKILNKTRINLTNGESAEHVVKCRPNRIWDNILDENTIGTGFGTTAGYTYMRGLTNFTMFVCWGAPGSVHSAPTTVGTAASVIDFIQTKEYKSTTLVDNGTWITVTNNVATGAITNVTAFGAGTTEAFENAS